MTASRTKRPLFDGEWLLKEIKNNGIPIPVGLNRERFFAVVCSIWNSTNGDFSKPKLDDKGVHFFKEFSEATICFHRSGYFDFMVNINGEIEVELFQYNRCIGRVIHSKILFP